MTKPPRPAPTASAIGPCPTVMKIVGRPGTGSLPSTIAPPDLPFECGNINIMCDIPSNYGLPFCEVWRNLLQQVLSNRRHDLTSDP